MAKMKTESLAVQYRPRNLTDLIGQDHISKQVLGMFKSGKMPSSIMLHGSTGLGKTTVARILTRMINCSAEERDENFTPCGECPSCRMTEHPDVLELNAAEARGIDDVRNLIQQSKNMPSLGNKRIFILDECFPADAVVELADGTFAALGDIVSSPERYVVKTFNHESGRVEPQPVIAGWSNGTKPGSMMEVELEDGSKQLASDNHRWWSVTRNCYVRTDELLPGEELSSSTDI